MPDWQEEREFKKGLQQEQRKLRKELREQRRKLKEECKKDRHAFKKEYENCKRPKPIRLTMSITVALFVFLTMLASAFILFVIFAALIENGVVNLDNSNPVLIVLVLLVVSVIMSTLLSLATGNHITRPVAELNRATRKITEGKYEARMNEKQHSREMRELAHNFNKMAQELESIELLRTDFITTISHEFKTPLAAIEGYATLLQEKDLGQQEREEYNSKIIESARQLSSLAGNILNISKLENQEIVFEKQDFRLDEQIRQTLLLLEPQWSEKNIDPDVQLSPVNYYGNEELLTDVWLNLFSNAIKFTPQDGTITAALVEDDSGVTVIISDSGIGMDEQTKEHIFEKFYQEDKNRYETGNGLGLTLVQRIVDLCGGRISVQSAPNQGSTFTVWLPKLKKPQK